MNTGISKTQLIFSAFFISDSKQKIVKWRFSGSVFKKYVEFTGISEIQIKKKPYDFPRYDCSLF